MPGANGLNVMVVGIDGSDCSRHALRWALYAAAKHVVGPGSPLSRAVDLFVPGQPDGAYLAAVRKRFALWILDTADAKFDQAWLDWQYEIGLRHNRVKKNKTDGAHGPAQVDFRYLPALTIPITTTLKPFLAKKGASAADVEKMHAAWVKAVLLQAILWSHPYVKDGEF